MWIVLVLSLSTLSWHKVVAFSLLTVSVVLAVLNDIIDWSVLFLLLQSFFYYFEVQLEI
ncbi:putative membrane protein [Escherichia coli DEC3F]|nr:putative membrane protein [Escherichia coli DEC3A]EHU76564.1 putative membrane protein [Escherichia coli DEC3C]EHU92793.1 putative membrane protein [Escherichia coli DEC3F]EHU93288.1 putative membrane protein [Escherichia coli DEC4A]EHV13068.1 putative membrane protein [Escherichia coli DEC4D]EHW64320.1 putative membrane protein [Escherichia coli DEC10A]